MHSIQALTDTHLTDALLAKLSLPAEIGQVPAQVWAARLEGEHQGQAAGFAVLWPTQASAQLWLHVAPGFRGQHCGRDLLAAAQSQAKTLGVHQLNLFSAVEPEDAPWFIEQGFAVWQTLRCFSIQGDVATEHLRRVWQRLQHQVPTGAQLITLAQAIEQGRLDEIVQKQTTVTGGLPSLLRKHIQDAMATGSEQLVSLQSSLVGLLDGKIISVLMVRFDELKQIWVVEAMFLEPAYRDGWALIWMRYAIAEVLLATARTNECRFEAQDDLPAIAHMAHRLKATEVPGRSLLTKKLAP